MTTKKYHISSNLNIEFNTHPDITFSMGKEKYQHPYYALPILSYFDSPKSLKEVGLEIQNKAENKAQVLSCMETIKLFIKQGVITSEVTPKTSSDKVYSWGGQNIHKKMLHDKTRTLAFEKAIANQVKDKVVLDIGSGTGILSFFALKHGAKHVYAIESNEKCIAYSKELAKANNLNNISFYSQPSTEVALPEQADVLISELIGNSPLGEKILPIMEDAKKRLVKKVHITIPGKLRIFALPVNFQNKQLDKFYFTSDDVKQWSIYYKLDFSSILQPSVNTNNLLFLKREEIENLNFLGEPILLENFNLENAINLAELDREISFKISKTGNLNGILIFFEAELDENTLLSTSPLIDYGYCSWKSTLYPLNKDSLQVKNGDQINFKTISQPRNRSVYTFQFVS